MSVKTEFRNPVFGDGIIKCLDNELLIYGSNAGAIALRVHPKRLEVAIVDREGAEVQELDEKAIRTFRDEMAIERIRSLLPYTDEEFIGDVEEALYLSGHEEPLNYPAFAKIHLLPGEYIVRRLVSGWLIAGGEGNAVVVILMDRQLYIYSAGDVMYLDVPCEFEPRD
jgi:hypothetical protein